MKDRHNRLGIALQLRAHGIQFALFGHSNTSSLAQAGLEIGGPALMIEASWPPTNAGAVVKAATGRSRS